MAIKTYKTFSKNETTIFWLGTVLEIEDNSLILKIEKSNSFRIGKIIQIKKEAIKVIEENTYNNIIIN